jgi:uncharacterized protein YqeY
MALDASLDQEIKTAMLAKDDARLRTLRAIKSAFLLAKTEKGANGIITAEQEIKVLQKLFNQRKESFEIFSKENRPELAQKEKEEMDIIGSLLPAQMSDEELKAQVEAIIAQVGATSLKDIGKVMGAASKTLAGKAEGGRISAMVKSLLPA